MVYDERSEWFSTIASHKTRALSLAESPPFLFRGSSIVCYNVTLYKSLLQIVFVARESESNHNEELVSSDILIFLTVDKIQVYNKIISIR